MISLPYLKQYDLIDTMASWNISVAKDSQYIQQNRCEQEFKYLIWRELILFKLCNIKLLNRIIESNSSIAVKFNPSRRILSTTIFILRRPWINVLPLKFKYVQSTIVINRDLKLLWYNKYVVPNHFYERLKTQPLSCTSYYGSQSSDYWLIGFRDGNVDSIVLIWSWGTRKEILLVCTIFRWIIATLTYMMVWMSMIETNQPK